MAGKARLAHLLLQYFRRLGTLPGRPDACPRRSRPVSPRVESRHRRVDCVAASEVADNNSFIFLRSGNSWHGVREVEAPEGHFRKAFIVVFEKAGLGARLLNRLGSERVAAE